MAEVTEMSYNGWLFSKVWSLWVTGLTKSSMINNNNANSQVFLQQQWFHSSSGTEALKGSLDPLAKLWY